MKILSSCHTHTSYVDGKSSARAQVERALELGFVSLGFSEHAQEAYCGLTPENNVRYIDEITALKREYAGRIKLWLGIERDRISTDPNTCYDYVLAANHYVNTRAVDGKPDELEAYAGGAWDEVIARYFDEYAAYVDEIKPDIIAHFDLICKYNRTRHWFSESEGAFIRCGKAALERMIKSCDVLEVNTGGTARSNQPCPYPVMPLLKYWHDLGGRVIPGSDCHSCLQLDAWYDKLPAYLREAGYSHILMPGVGDKLFDEYAL